MVDRPRLVLFPGLGADERLFAAQREMAVDVEVPKWIASEGRGETLAAYARRVSGTIRTRPPYWVGGVSFGGMVAMEVARRLGPGECLGVILISSCRSRASLPWAARLMGPMAGWVPARAAYLVKWMACPVRTVFGASTRDQVGLFKAMLRDTPAGFLHWSMCRAATWEGVGEVGVPVFQVHGERDRVILCPREGAEVVAGHLMNVTHAGRVNEFIERCVKGGVQ